MSGLDELSREELISIILEQHQQIGSLEKEVEYLRSQLGGGNGKHAPDFVKPNRKQRREAERAERKKRSGSYVRRLDIATEEIVHVVEKCPDCGRKLSGGWEHDRRQVIEIPDTPVRIIEHVIVARRCGVCGKVHIPKLGISDGVIGRQRVGVKLMSFIAMLSIANRVPQRMIQRFLECVYGVHISVGEINGILHKVGGYAKSAAQDILRQIRGSPHAHSDETGWRECGINGYLWSLSTDDLRYFDFDRSRAGAVAQRLLGICFGGVLVCDFYAGYNFYDGPIQRCWVHLLRDLKKLVESNPEDASVPVFMESIKALYKAAKKIAKRGFVEEMRMRLRGELESKLLLLAEPYLKNETAPQHVLAERIDRHLGELFTFVVYSGCPSGNNAAERAIRPAVIARKISGGTRSEKGSQTRTRLMSVFGTWALQGKDLLRACADMIISSHTQAELASV